MRENARIIFAKNLQTHLDRSGKTQADLVRDLKYKQPTVSDWVTGKKYPRVDKMQELADYFGVLMSDLTKEKPATPEGDGLNKEAVRAYTRLCAEIDGVQVTEDYRPSDRAQRILKATMTSALNEVREQKKD